MLLCETAAGRAARAEGLGLPFRQAPQPTRCACLRRAACGSFGGTTFFPFFFAPLTTSLSLSTSRYLTR